MAIEFTNHTQTASLYSPIEDFEKVTVEMEVRKDPLLDRQSRIVDASFVMPDDEPDIEELVNNTEGCFFCPGTVEEATPTYADVDMERGSVGDAVSFPNLNPYAEHSNVVAISEEHYSSPAQFEVEELSNGVEAALEYVDAVEESDPDADFAAVNMNFLRPAGSSIIHPHLQTIVDDRGTTRQRTMLDASRSYRNDHDSSYWSTLLSEERDGPRYIGTSGDVEWLAPFAPRHHRHVRGILPERPRAGSDVIEDVASGLKTVLDHYADNGLNSFNFSLFVSPEDPALPPTIDVIARSVFGQYYWSDSPFFTVLHDEAVIDVAPETYAADISERL
ncbi:MAG: hypothetical protein ACOC8O_03575 [Natronomonas sp.]